MFLPLDGTWAVDAKKHRSSINNNNTFVTPATIAFKLFITWLYFDAGYGKYTDPLQGWTLNPPHFLPALDTYVRHTTVARYVYGLLGPTGLRYMTPTVVYVELLCAPVVLLGSFIYGKQSGANGSKGIMYGVIGVICNQHGHPRIIQIHGPIPPCVAVLLLLLLLRHHPCRLMRVSVESEGHCSVILIKYWIGRHC